MKKIIDGRRYDTSSARCLASDRYLSPRDFHYWEETLYRKTNGEYFLHGEGGPASKYAVSTGQNQWSGGEKLIPLSLEAAQKWGEEHLDGDLYEEIFGVVDDTETKRTVGFSLTESVIEAIKRNALAENKSMSDYIADLVLRQK